MAQTNRYIRPPAQIRQGRSVAFTEKNSGLPINTGANATPLQLKIDFCNFVYCRSDFPMTEIFTPNCSSKPAQKCLSVPRSEKLL